MKLGPIFMSLFFLGSNNLLAQNLVELQGKILDKETVIQNADVSVLNSSIKAMSNQLGIFKLTGLKPGDYTLQINAEGYSTLLVEVSLKSDIQYDFELIKLGKQLSEVVVTAQKQQTNLQSTPVSVTSLNALTIKDAKIWNTNDLAGFVPNLSTGHPGDYRTVTSIRGVVTTSYDPAVATYIDGVNQFGLDTYISQLNDVEVIEVLRGPQGTLFGRNATGGVLNIVTKQPNDQFGGFIDLSYGNFNSQRYAAGLEGAFVKDKLFFGAAGMFTKQDGFYRNEFINSTYDDQRGGQGNYYLRYQANSRLSFLINVKHQLQLNNGAFPLAGSPADALDKPFILDQNNTTQMRDRSLNGSVSANYYHPNWTFTSQTSYQENYRYYVDPIDGDFSSFDIISVVNNYGSKFNNVKVGMQEFRLASPATQHSPLRWQLGAYGFIQDNPVKQGTHFGADAGMYGSPMINFTSISTNLGTGIGVAFFGQGTFAINPKLDVIAGLRYDYEDQKQKIKGEFAPDGGNIMITRPDTSSSASFNAFSPKLALNYKMSPENYLYGSYSKGFRAGGISQLSAEPSEPPLVSYNPEYSNNFEIGTKNKFFDNRMKLNIALFYTRLDDVQVPTLILPDAITVVKNAGKLTSKGVDVELSVLLARGLAVDYNFGLTDAYYQSLVLEDQGSNVSYKNNWQIFTPKTTSFLALQYSLPLTSIADSRLMTRVEWKNFGSQYFDLKNTIKQDAYNVLNARLSFQHKSNELAVWASNLIDEHYINYAYNFGATHLGNPRTYGVSLISKF